MNKSLNKTEQKQRRSQSSNPRKHNWNLACEFKKLMSMVQHHKDQRQILKIKPRQAFFFDIKHNYHPPVITVMDKIDDNYKDSIRINKNK